MTSALFIQKYGNNILTTGFGMNKQTVSEYINSLPEWAHNCQWHLIRGRSGKFARVKALTYNIGILAF